MCDIMECKPHWGFFFFAQKPLVVIFHQQEIISVTFGLSCSSINNNCVLQLFEISGGG